MYVYVITRIVDGQPTGVTSIPNLGCHSSLQKAERHFESVEQSRKENGYEVIHWDFQKSKDLPSINKEKVHVLREVSLKKETERESVRLEKWKI